jgi:hypothetical protein
MKKFVLSAFVIIAATTAFSQVTYTTAASGNYTVGTTWVGGAAGAPPTSGTCNCKIVVKAGHTLTLNLDNMNITDANFVLDGVNSVLTLSNNVDVTLAGTSSSIDIQNTQARLSKTTGSTATITMGGQVIFNSSSTQFNSTTNGLVNGLASASSRRANPQFQSGTLPVKLSEFKVSSKGSGVGISWKTSLEVNSSHFDIERSGDSKSWTSIGTVQASGNVSVEQSYSFTDAAPANGTNYYRLKIVDIDSKFDYSPIKSVSFTATALNVIASPNPASSFININVTAPGNEPYRLRLINRSGQVVFDQKYAASTGRLQLAVSNYADGSYFLEVTNSNGLRQINKVMIVRK